MMACGELPPEGLLVCRADKALLGTIAALPLKGAAGLIWPPQVVAGVSKELVEDLLVTAALDLLRQRGAKLVQALLAVADAGFAVPLERHDFKHITTLLYLHKTRAEPVDLSKAASRLQLHTYAVCDREKFQAMLLDSYEGSCDCPELNGIRTADEIVAGYQAVPGCKLERWWLAELDKCPVGVLITTATQEWGTWELLYVGLVPAARGKGLGAELTRFALIQARSAGAKRMILTVDLSNQAALRMYASLGFAEYDRREVYLRLCHRAWCESEIS